MSPCPHKLLTYWALEAVKVYGRFIGPRYLVFTSSRNCWYFCVNYAKFWPLCPLKPNPSHYAPLLLSLQEVKSEFPVIRVIVVVAVLLRLYTFYEQFSVKPNYKVYLRRFHMYKNAVKYRMLFQPCISMVMMVSH